MDKTRRSTDICPRYMTPACSHECARKACEVFAYYDLNKPPIYEFCPLQQELVVLSMYSKRAG